MLGSKITIYVPKIGIFGDFTTNMWSSINTTHKRQTVSVQIVIIRLQMQARDYVLFNVPDQPIELPLFLADLEFSGTHLTSNIWFLGPTGHRPLVSHPNSI